MKITLQTRIIAWIFVILLLSVVGDALKLGAVDYRIKPFSYERFKASLEKYAQRHRLLREEGAVTQGQLDALLGAAQDGSKVQLQKGMHYNGGKE